MNVSKFRKTKRPSRKKKDREARRNRILSGAMDLIELKGMSGMSLHQLAKELDYTVGALYRYFPSKDALIAELQIQVIELLHQSLLDLRRDALLFLEGKKANESTAALFSFLLFGEFYLEYSVEAKAHFRLNARILQDSKAWLKDEEAMQVLQRAQQVFSYIENLLIEANLSKPNQKMDFPEKTFIYWSALHGVMQTQKLSRLSESLQLPKFVRELTQTLLLGWGTDPKELKKAIQFAEDFIKENSLKERAKQNNFSSLK